MVIDKNSPKAPNLESTSFDPHVKEIMEVQSQAQANGVMEVHVHIQKIEAFKVLPIEIRS